MTEIETDTSTKKFCPACGKEIIPAGNYCPFCGHSLDESKSERIQIADQDFAAYVVNNAGYYLVEFRKFNIAGSDVFSLTWNWAAFLGGFGWLLYRKMYLWSLIAFIIAFVPYFGLAAWISLGAVANYLYYQQAKRKILEMKALHPSTDISVALSHIGGVNRWVPVAATVFTIIFLLLFMALFFLIPFSFFNFFNYFRPPSKYI